MIGSYSAKITIFQLWIDSVVVFLIVDKYILLLYTHCTEFSTFMNIVEYYFPYGNKTFFISTADSI